MRRSRFRLAASLFPLLASVTACDDERPPMPTEKPVGSTSISAAAIDSVVGFGRTVSFDSVAGVGDLQRLAVGTCPDNCRHGPLVAIQPATNSHLNSEGELAGGRVIARLVNHSNQEYAKLAVVPNGVTYWFVFRNAEGEWRSRYVPDNRAHAAAAFEDEMHLALHDPATRPPWTRATARWLWSDDDEGTWESCVRTGCCTSKGYEVF